MINIGIMDPKGLNMNPLTDKPYSDNYRELAKIWSTFPVYQKAEYIISEIEKNKVILLITGTGSGKTYLTPKFVLHTFEYQKKIIITLPKKIITQSSAEISAKSLDVELGQEVGYRYRGKSVESEYTKLLYMTDGSLLSIISRDPLLSDYNAVIIDEVHERKINIDLLLYLLKYTLNNRDDFKLILMSATVDSALMESYYRMYSAQTIQIEGSKRFPVESIYTDYDTDINDYLKSGYEILKQIIHSKTNDDGGIIFFVTSKNDAESICRRISEDNIDGYCIEVFSGMDDKKENIAKDKELYKQFSNKTRKIILATPVAESSITFEGLKYVIDSGLELFSYYDPEKDCNNIIKKYISKSNVTQRLGRVGRTEPGICYHLYSKTQYDKLSEYAEPNIRTENIMNECFKLLNLPNISGRVDMLLNVLTDLIEPPREKYIKAAVNGLHMMGLVDDSELTTLGKKIMLYNTDPTSALALYIGRKLNCAKEVAVMLSILEACKNNISEMFFKPLEIVKNNDKYDVNKLNKKFRSAMANINNKYGDHIVLYRLMNEYIKYDDLDKINKFLYNNFLNRKSMEAAKILYNRMRKIIRITPKEDKIDELYDEKLIYKLLSVMYLINKNHTGILSNSTQVLYDSKYMDNIRLSRDSFLRMQKDIPKNIFFQEIFNNNGTIDINIASRTSPKILEICDIINNKIRMV